MKAKYVEELFPRWFIFGRGPNDSVDLSDGDRDVARGITEEQARELIEARDVFVDSLVAFFLSNSDVLNKVRRN